MGDYSYILATVGLEHLQDEAFALSVTLDKDDAPAQASRIRKAFFRLLEDLVKISENVADVAEKKIVELESHSRVRDDTEGNGGPRLEDFVGHSHPLLAVEGSVGVNFEPDLDRNGVRWWPTNEDGSTARIGDEIKGFFSAPGGRFTAPNAAQFREHPLFSARAKGPSGEIENPIPARHFVRDGFLYAEAKWHAEIRVAKDRFLRECDLALASAPRPKPAGKPRP